MVRAADGSVVLRCDWVADVAPAARRWRRNRRRTESQESRPHRRSRSLLSAGATMSAHYAPVVAAPAGLWRILGRRWEALDVQHTGRVFARHTRPRTRRSARCAMRRLPLVSTGLVDALLTPHSPHACASCHLLCAIPPAPCPTGSSPRTRTPRTGGHARHPPLLGGRVTGGGNWCVLRSVRRGTRLTVLMRVLACVCCMHRWHRRSLCVPRTLTLTAATHPRFGDASPTLSCRDTVVCPGRHVLALEEGRPDRVGSVRRGRRVRPHHGGAPAQDQVLPAREGTHEGLPLGCQGLRPARPELQAPGTGRGCRGAPLKRHARRALRCARRGHP